MLTFIRQIGIQLRYSQFSFSHLKREKGEIDELCSCLKTVKESLEKENSVPEGLDIPKEASNEIKSCYRSLLVICEKCHKCLR